MAGGLAEADAGVDDDPAARDSCRLGCVDLGGQRVEHVKARVAVAGLLLHRLRRALHVAQHDPRVLPGNDRARLRIVGECADIVHDPRARCERGVHHRRTSGIDRDQKPVIGQRTNHGNHPAHLLRLARRLRAGPGRFAADIDDVGAGFSHGKSVRRGVVPIGEIAAIGEAVRSHVEDAHQTRPVERKPAHRPAGRGEAGAQRRDFVGRAGRVLLGPAGENGVLQPHLPACRHAAEQHVHQVEGECGTGDRVAGPEIDAVGKGLRRGTFGVFGRRSCQRYRRHGGSGAARSPAADGARDRAVSCPCAGWRRAPSRAAPA